MLRFSLLRVPILIHPSLWITLALFGGVWGIECVNTFLYVLYFMVAGFFCLLIHEIGHATVGRFFGGGQPQVLLSALGGECCNPGARLTRYQGILMTAAGPFFSMLLGVLAMLVIFLSNGNDAGDMMMRTLAYIKGESPHVPLDALPNGVMILLRSLIVVSFWWTALNLIPVYPLDGGQILCGLMDVQQMGLAHAVSIYAAILFFLFFLVFGFWLLSFFMLILLYINFRWWRLYTQARRD